MNRTYVKRARCDMAAFDALPKRLRRALANSVYDRDPIRIAKQLTHRTVEAIAKQIKRADQRAGHVAVILDSRQNAAAARELRQAKHRARRI